MTAGRVRAVLVGMVVVVFAGAAAIALNVLLLDRASAQHDRIGRLSPGARLPSAAPTWTLRPVERRIEDGAADD